MDLVAIGNEFSKWAPTSQSLIVLAIASIGFALLYLSNSGRKLREQLNETVFSNWRLALLGTTGIVLSLASGWTTWDGMRNFTQEPVLSLMITFGIQGVMLIVAWLIGESFATGMNFRPARAAGGDRPAGSLRALEPFVGTAIGILVFVALALLILNQIGGTEQLATDTANSGWLLVPSGILLAAILILMSITLLLNSGGDIVSDYLQAMRVIVRSAVLWVMFLACMATSVFFSFDSLFSTIFPQAERVRAADLRAQNQVAGVITDIGGLATRRRIEEHARLFEAEGWKRYDETLEQLVIAARQAPQALQDYFEKKMRDRQKVVAQRQGEKAAAESQQIVLKQRGKLLNEEISRFRSIVTQLSPVVEDLKSKIFAKDQEVVAKTAEAEAEAGGIGVTSKSGRGPKYREISGELRILNGQKKNLQLQLREYEKRLSAARDSISRNETQVSIAQGELATLQGRAHTAEQLIQLARRNETKDEPAFDPAAGLRQLERARITFRQEPTQKGLARIQGLCTTIVGAMAEVPTLKSQSSQFDCDPGEANEVSGRVFALNSGLAALGATCVDGDKLPKTGGADALFAFARKCVQDASLPSTDTDDLRTRINYLELNRDDKAHRFVVTTNAFGDGNKLAYLALAIAIAIDLLVFMSGLFGANAVRSPLSDVPTHKGRTAKQLEAIIDTALQPHPYDTARRVLDALRPITPVDGYTSEINVDDADPHAAEMRRILNAGSSIGAVRHVDGIDRVYQVRAEFNEYLSIAQHRDHEKGKSENRVSMSELERTVAGALLPNIEVNAGIILDNMHPIREEHGFMAEIRLDEIEDQDHVRVVRYALNAGAVYQRVRRVKENTSHYFIHSDFFKTLTNLRGRLLMSGGQAQGGMLPIVAPPVINVEDTAKQIVDARPQIDPTKLSANVRGQLLEALGIDSQLYQKSREAVGLAVNAQIAINRLIDDADPAISRELNAEMNEAGERLSRTSNNLLSEFRGVDGATEIIDDIRVEIDEMLPVFMMHPGARYYTILEAIIAQLESAAQSDSDLAIGEQELLDRLRGHAIAFATATSIERALETVEEYLTKPEMLNVVRLGDRTNSA